jgi:hypothetical protein
MPPARRRPDGAAAAALYRNRESVNIDQAGVIAGTGVKEGLPKLSVLDQDKSA